jgi:hypothetical protein
MSKGIVTSFAGTLSLLLLTFIEGYSQETSVTPVKFMFYNVENLFDTYDDTLTEDNEFLAHGVRRWNSGRYFNKIFSLNKTILATGEWNTPALVGFCEVENRKVLEDLVYGTSLSKFNFGIIHEDSPDPRGIDVCLIYRKDLIVIPEYKYLIPDDFNKDGFFTRSVLYAKCIVYGDTIHLFVNHWPSRRGGVLAGEPYRLKTAEMIRNKTDSIISVLNGDARIIILGDFNSTPDDLAIDILTGRNVKGLSMVNLSESLQAGTGTYRYMGTWEMIDQVIVSDKLLNCAEGLYTEKDLLRIFRPDFLLKDDKKYPGLSPYPTYSGYRYQGGYSDHLPVLLDLKVR